MSVEFVDYSNHNCQYKVFILPERHDTVDIIYTEGVFRVFYNDLLSDTIFASLEEVDCLSVISRADNLPKIVKDKIFKECRWS